MSGAIKAVTGSLGLSSGNAGKQPAIPAVQRPRDIINKILGVSTKEVKDENGNISIVTDLVLSPEEEERLNKLEASYDTYLSNLNQLSELTAAIDNPAYQPVVSALRENQRIARQEAYDQRTALEEDTLARRGLADSRAGAQLREARGKDLQQQIVTDENNLTLMAEDLRQQQYTRTAQSLSFASNELFRDKEQKVNQGTNNLSSMTNLFGVETGAINAAYQNQISAYNARSTANNNIFGNIGGLARTAGTIFGLFG